MSSRSSDPLYGVIFVKIYKRFDSLLFLLLPRTKHPNHDKKKSGCFVYVNNYGGADQYRLIRAVVTAPAAIHITRVVPNNAQLPIS